MVNTTGISKCSRRRVRIWSIVLRACGIFPRDTVYVTYGKNGFDELVMTQNPPAKQKIIATYTVELDGSIRLHESTVGPIDESAATITASKGRITILRG
jgi:hypothetical protein